MLSLSHEDRSLSTQFGTKHFWRGFKIGCYNCHNGPTSDNRIRNAAAYARAEKRAPEGVRRLSSLAAGGAAPPAEDPTPSRIAAADELQELYDRAVSELRPRQREVVLLHRYAGLSWSEITTQLGCPSEAAARELYRRARMELALRLERTLGTEGER